MGFVCGYSNDVYFSISIADGNAEFFQKKDC